MKTRVRHFGWLAFSLGILFMSCDKETEGEVNFQLLDKLYYQYLHGEIALCQYNNETVYHCTLNAYDTGSTIYAANGQVLGHCSYLESLSDPICNEISNCRVIYRTADAITSQPPVDEYHLVYSHWPKFWK